LTGARGLEKPGAPPQTPDFGGRMEMRQASAPDAPKNWNEIKDAIGKPTKPGDPLPEGYTWVKGADGEPHLRRKGGYAEDNFASLEVKDGKFALREGVEWLSNPAVVKRNFETAVRAELQSKGFTGVALERAVQRELGRVQIHHLIPDELVRTTELGQAARKAGYNLDRSENLIGLAKSAEAKLTPDEIGHWTNHPEYTTAVKERLDNAVKELKADYGALEQAPKEAILQKMKEVEDEFRKLIESKEVKTKDGRLATLPPSQDWRRA
jgi:hypothetical protein